MPCQAHLLRLRDSRHVFNHIHRHAVTCPSRQLRQYPSDAREAARLKTRIAALKRLDEHIKPEDLSATLEAHRDANRASLIRKCFAGTDPDVVRPTSLVEGPPAIRRYVTDRRAADQVQDGAQAALTEFNKMVTNFPDLADDATSFQLRSLDRATEAAAIGEDEKFKRRHNSRWFLRWIEFLKEHEDPVQPFPTYNFADRAAFFSVLRRVSAVIRREQNAAKTSGPVEGLAPRFFLSYEGFAQPLFHGQKFYSRLEAWSRRPRGNDYDMKTWLETEIDAFAEWMDLTPSESVARRKLSESLIDLIRQADPILQAETFGSLSTGLVMPNSDIDIRIADESLEHLPYQGEPDDKAAKAAWAQEKSAQRKVKMISHLRTIQSAMAKHQDFDEVELNDSAFFPLVRAVHLHTGLKIQIVSTKDPTASREATKGYLTEYPTLRPIFLVLKTTLNLRNMSDPWTGGFGSYTLFMMCVAALKHRDEQGSNKIRSLSLDFLHTLNFWKNFDTNKFALSVEPFTIFPKRNKPGLKVVEERKTDPSLWARTRIAQPLAYKPYMLHLQDPADPYNDLGRSALAIKDLQATFAKLYDDLTWELQDPSRRQDPTALLKSFVGRSERYFDEMRIPVDLWGGQFLQEDGEGMKGGEGIEDPLRDVVDERISRRVLG